MTRHHEKLDCESARLEGSRALDVSLAPELQERLNEHLADCADCRAVVAGISSADGAARDALAGLRRHATDEASVAATARAALTRVAAGERPEAVAPFSTAERSRGARALAAAMLLVAGGAVLALLLRASHRDEPDPELAQEEQPPAERPVAPTDRFGRGLVSCEVDPRGIDVHWERLHPGDGNVYWIERYDSDGRQVAYHDIEGESFLDTDIVPGEEYFYVVRERRTLGEEFDAYVGTASAAQDEIADDIRVRYLGGTRNAALLEITFAQDGESYTAHFPLEVGARVGGKTTVPGKGLASFDTPYHLMAIDWDADRVVVDPATGEPVHTRSRCVRLSTPSGTPLTLWIRD